MGPGDVEILPANPSPAPAGGVAGAGPRPVLVDIDESTYLIDPDAALEAVTGATRAIAPVHLYGQMAPVEKLVGQDLPIVEDAAQCQGATRFGRAPATFTPLGIAGTSFYPGKNLGAYGDAGAVVTSDEGLATAVRRLSQHGGLRKYEHEVMGVNSRLDAMQAVVLRAKLARLGAWNELRRAAAARYDVLLQGLDVVRPSTLEGNEHVWHLYVIRVAERRDEVVAKLNAAGIGAGIHYPVPVHLTGAFSSYSRGSFPVAERTAQQILSLPLFPQITAEQQERVVSALAQALA